MIRRGTQGRSEGIRTRSEGDQKVASGRPEGKSEGNPCHPRLHERGRAVLVRRVLCEPAALPQRACRRECAHRARADAADGLERQAAVASVPLQDRKGDGALAALAEVRAAAAAAAAAAATAAAACCCCSAASSFSYAVAADVAALIALRPSSLRLRSLEAARLPGRLRSPLLPLGPRPPLVRERGGALKEWRPWGGPRGSQMAVEGQSRRRREGNHTSIRWPSEGPNRGNHSPLTVRHATRGHF